MKARDNMMLALRMFRTRPMRTSLTIFGVSVGIGTVLFLVSLGYGLQQAILNRIASADALLALDITTSSDAIRLTPETVERIREIPHVTEISRLKNVRAQLALGEINTDVVAVAVDPSFFRLNGVTARIGEIFTDETVGKGVLSSAAVKLLGKEDEGILNSEAKLFLSAPHRANGEENETIREMSGSALIIGVIENEDISEIYLPLTYFNAVTFPDYDRLKVKVEKSDYLTEVRAEIMAAGFTVSALSDTIDQANKIFRVVQIVLGLFGLVALIVSAIGMFNTMTIALLERTSEIGIMRSIGITRRDIRTMFLVESMLMGFLGGLAGIAMSSIGGLVVNTIINFLAGKFNGPPMDIFYTPTWFMLVVVMFSAFIGFLTGVYPSYRASKLNPLDALRYK